MLRLATPDDADALQVLMKQFYDEAPHKDFIEWDEEVARQRVAEFLSAERNEKVVILSEHRGEIIGVLAAVAITSSLFASEKRAYEAVWYVKPEHRFRPSALGLVRAYEFWARKVGCSTVSMSTMGAAEKLSKVYERQGYSLLEKSYVKRL